MKNFDIITEGCYERWKAGLCPCCGGDFCAYAHAGRDGLYDIVRSTPIAEDVKLCGRCFAQEHHLIVDDESGKTVGQLILMALVIGNRESSKIQKV